MHSTFLLRPDGHGPCDTAVVHCYVSKATIQGAGSPRYELGTAGGLELAPGGAPKKRWKPCWSWVTSMIRMTVVVLPLTVAVTTTWLPTLMEPIPSRWAFTMVELV